MNSAEQPARSREGSGFRVARYTRHRGSVPVERFQKLGPFKSASVLAGAVSVVGLLAGTAMAVGVQSNDTLPFPNSVAGYCDEFTAAAVAGDDVALGEVIERARFDLSAPSMLLRARQIVGVSCLEERAGDGTSEIIAIVFALGVPTAKGADGLLLLLPSGQSVGERADWTDWVHDTYGRQTSLLDIRPAGDRALVVFFDNEGGRQLRHEAQSTLDPLDRVDLTSLVAGSISAAVRPTSVNGG